MTDTKERPEDFGTDNQGQVKRWLLEIQLAGKREKTWRKKAAEVEDRYADEKDRGGTRFNILWANTELLKPAIFGETPKPDVRRRHSTEDPIAKNVSIGLERALSFSVDNPSHDFDDSIGRAVLDYLLPGRGVVRVHYRPINKLVQPRIPVQATFPEDGSDAQFFQEDGTEVDNPQFDDEGSFVLGPEEEQLEFEETYIEHIIWDDYREGPGRKWEHVPWVAYRHVMTRDDLVDNFGKEIGNKVKLTLDHPDVDTTDKGTEKLPADIFKRAEVWEVWDKSSKEVRFVSEGYKDGFLKVKPDPLQLKNFFPQPEPIISVVKTRSRIPIPEFTLYQDQANELDKVTSRIDLLVSALKVRGLYDEAHGEIKRLLDQSDDNKMIGVADWARLATEGGIANLVDWFPIEQVAGALVGLYQQRDNLINTIFQVTGISDIFRGATDPRETLGAQQIKSQFGSLRLRPRQKKVQKFIRDIFDIQSEIMANKFSGDTLTQMTGMEVDETVLGLLRQTGLRDFRVDVESDSTIAVDEQAEKAAVSEFLGAMGVFMEQATPLIESGFLEPEAAKVLLLWAARRFKVSREVEDVLEGIGRSQGRGQDGAEGSASQPPADPVAMLKLQAEQQQFQAEMQFDVAKMTGEQQIAAAELQLKFKELEGEAQDRQFKLAIEMGKLQVADKVASRPNGGA